MADTSICNQHGCGQPAAFRFTWPGKDEAGICDKHAKVAKRIAEAMGFELQLIPVHVDPPLATFLRGG